MGTNSGALDCDCCGPGPEPPCDPLWPPGNAHSVIGVWTKHDPFIDSIPGVFDKRSIINVIEASGTFQSKLMPPDGAGRLFSLTDYFTPDRNANWPQKSCVEVCGANQCNLPPAAPFTSIGCNSVAQHATINRTSGNIGVFSQQEYLDPGMLWSHGTVINTPGSNPNPSPGGSSFASSLSRAGDADLSGFVPNILQSGDGIYIENRRNGGRIGWETDTANFDEVPVNVQSLWDFVLHCRDPKPIKLLFHISINWLFGICVSNNTTTPGAHVRTNTFWKLYPDTTAAADRHDIIVDFDASFCGTVQPTDLGIARKLHIPIADQVLWQHGVQLVLPAGAAAVPGPGGQANFVPSQIYEAGTDNVVLDVTPLYQATDLRSNVLGFYCGISPQFAPSQVFPGRMLTNIFGQRLNPFGNPPGILSPGGFCSIVRVTADITNLEFVFEA